MPSIRIQIISADKSTISNKKKQQLICNVCCKNILTSFFLIRQIIVYIFFIDNIYCHDLYVGIFYYNPVMPSKYMINLR